MKIVATRYEGELRITLDGELDHHAARRAVSETAQIIDEELPRRLLLDFDRVSFMDSSGIALIIGAHNKMKNLNGGFSVINVSKQAYKVLRAAGITIVVDVAMKQDICKAN